MSRTLVDLDDQALKDAATELGTHTKVDTVNTAFREIAARRVRLKLLETLDDLDLDLGARTRADAWR
jgi:Arc/MetJ family transcription regulator